MIITDSTNRITFASGNKTRHLYKSQIKEFGVKGDNILVLLHSGVRDVVHEFNVVTNAQAWTEHFYFDYSTVTSPAGSASAAALAVILNGYVDSFYSVITDQLDQIIDRLEQLEGGYGALIGKQSGGDFTTARGATNRIDCTSMPTEHPTLLAEDIEKVVKIIDTGESDDPGAREEYLPGDGTGGTYVMTVSTNNITVTGMTSGTNDDFIVYTNVRKSLVSDQTTKAALQAATDVGVSDDTWVDAGAEVDVRDRNIISLYTNLTISDSSGVQIQVLSKSESAGADEYLGLDSEAYLYTYTDANQKRVVVADVTGWAYVQVQTKATDVDTGGGTIATMAIDYILD